MALSTATGAAVGARIRTVRFRLDQSERRFADMLGVKPEAVKMWESGRGVDRDALILIADATGVALHWLIAGFTSSQVKAIYSATKGARSRSGGEPTGSYAEM